MVSMSPSGGAHREQHGQHRFTHASGMHDGGSVLFQCATFKASHICSRTASQKSVAAWAASDTPWTLLIMVDVKGWAEMKASRKTEVVKKPAAAWCDVPG
eukprot:154145-Rhodomonas_salina.2